MPHAHSRASAAPPPPPPPASFGAFLARHDLPAAEALPPRAAALAMAAFSATPRYVPFSEPPRAMARAAAECREFQAGLLELAAAIVECDRAGRPA